MEDPTCQPPPAPFLETPTKPTLSTAAPSARETERLVPAVAAAPDMPIPGKPGSVGICPDNSYQYVPNTGMCKPR